MIDLANPHLFTAVTHPGSGVTLHILAKKVAPVQQGFYFVNDAMDADGRYLWFYCAFPPSLTRTLGVVDFRAGEVRHFPETQFGGASPYVDPATGDVFWSAGAALWRRGAAAGDHATLVNQLPEEVMEGRAVRELATHLTRSADGAAFFIDAEIGLQHIFGAMPADGGAFEFWWRFDRCHNHAQFSPTDPDEVLFAQELHPDPITGLTFPITNRLWTMRRGGKPRPVLREPKWVTHEWWDPDGAHAWCVWGNETWRVRTADGEVEKIPFPRHCWHSHSSRDGRLIVGDSNTGFFRGCASTVHFMNRDTRKVVILAEHAERTDYAGRHYHIDPHPRFCGNDRYVVFTTTVRNQVDVAVVPVDHLIERTS